MKISNRVQNIESTFTVALRIEADERKASGEDVIDLGLGDINFGQPPNFTKALVKAAQKGVNRYTEPEGTLELRKAIARANNNLYGGAYQGKIVQPKYEAEEIVHATSAKLLILAAATSIANPGDEIIVLAPYWPSYIDTLKLACVKPVVCYTTKEDNFCPSKEQLSSVVTKKTKGVIVNSPNNPTGRVYTKNELKEIADFAQENDLVIISDEVYDTIVFGKNVHYSIAAISDEVAQRTIVIKGLSKGFGMGGIRFGYAMSKNNKFVEALSKVVSNMITSAPSVLQEAGPALFLKSIDHVIRVRETFEKRVKFTEDFFRKNGIDFTEVQGAPYIFPDISSYFNKDITNSKSFMQRLIKETGVVVLHGGICGNDKYVRIALIQDIPILEKALERMIKFIRGKK